MELASRATLTASTLIVLTLLLHRFESPPPPPSPSHAASPASPLRAAEPPTLQRQPAALRSAGNGTMHFWHVTDWHLNLFHRPDGDVRDMCRSATGDRVHWPGPLGHFNCDPSRAVAQMAVRRMAAAQPAPAFLLLGGDNFGHVPPAAEDGAAVRASHVAMAELRTSNPSPSPSLSPSPNPSPNPNPSPSPSPSPKP